MHFFIDLLACKSVDRSTFCMKRDCQYLLCVLLCITWFSLCGDVGRICLVH